MAGVQIKTFKALANNLSDRFCVYSIDLPGFGESEIGLPLNLYEVADIIHNFCIKLTINNPIILGHSYGGRIAIIYGILIAKYKKYKFRVLSRTFFNRNNIDWKSFLINN